MPAARVSPASIERNDHSCHPSQRRQVYDPHPSTRSAVHSRRPISKVGDRKQRHLPVHARQDLKVANGKLSHCDSIKSEEKDGKRTWVSFAKRYREWTTRYDNSPRVVDFYGQFEPQSSFNFNPSSHHVQTNEFPSSIKPKTDSPESTGSSNVASSGNNTLTDNEVGSRNSLQFIHSSNCVPSTEPNGHSSNIGITKAKKNESGRYPKTGSSPSHRTAAGAAVMSPYERIVKCISQNDRWRRELTLGRRIGFYRIRGDLGSEKVAIKILDKSKLDSKTQTMLNREIGSMEKLHHPNLVQLFEVIENFSKIHLVLEYASGGELYQKISNQGKLIEPVAKSLFVQIISAIDHMHRHHIIHRDIKAENVFFSDPETVKVGDFGFSTEVESKSDLLNTYCGSPPYAAPELFSDECYIGPPVDLWACGVLLFFMVTAQMPFKAATVTALKKLILDGDFIIPDYVSVECSWLIRSLLQRNPMNRLETKDVQADKWLKGFSFPGSLPKYKYTRDFGINNSHQKVPSPPLIVDIVSEEVPDWKGMTSDEEKETKDKGAVSDEEKEAIDYMKKLGISEEMLITNQTKGVRSSITGIFRITIYRIISGKHLTSGTSKHYLDEKENPSPPISSNAIPLNNRSSEREIDTIQNNRSNVPSETSSFSKGENEWEKSTEKVVKLRKGSNNNLMRMPQIFTDSEGYITLPRDQVKTSEINSGHKINGVGNGTEEYYQDQLSHLHHPPFGLKTVAFDITESIDHDMKIRKKKSWKERLINCCVS